MGLRVRAIITWAECAATNDESDGRSEVARTRPRIGDGLHPSSAGSGPRNRCTFFAIDSPGAIELGHRGALG